MDRHSVAQHPEPDLLSLQNQHYVLKRAGSARSRSPPHKHRGTGADSGRRYRERSRSPPRKERTSEVTEKLDESEDAEDYQVDRHRSASHRHRRHRDQDDNGKRSRERRSDGDRVRSLHHSHQPERLRRSPAPKIQDSWDDEGVISRSGARRRSNHLCIDSALSQPHPGAGARSPASTSAEAPTIRLPPPETEQHYASHRCHHHDHNDSPSRSTTPVSHSTHHRHRRRSPSSGGQSTLSRQAVLPYGARFLSRWDFAAFEPLFAHYLEKHKHIRIADLDEDSVRDRWKGFVSKWNAGDLDRSWYEPEMFLRVVRLRTLEEARVRAAVPTTAPPSGRGDGEPAVMTPPVTGATLASETMASVVTDGTHATGTNTAMDQDLDNDDDDDDDYAPPLPPPAQGPGQSSINDLAMSVTTANSYKPGPAIPTLSDLELRRALESESQADHLSAIRLSRRADRAVQKERLDELVPRPEAGTRERQLEKRRATTEVMREFASGREAGEAEVPEAELLGGGADDDYRRMLEGMRRARTDREVRREEVQRARNVERDERIREARAREEERLGLLREMARARFG